jgi:hypothetical protein
MQKYLVACVAGLGAALAFTAMTDAQAKSKVAVIESSVVAVKPGSTWAWVITTSSADPRVANDIMQDRLETAVETTLAAKGLRQVPNPASAQFLVAYHVRLENRVEPKTTSVGTGRVCGFRGCISGYQPTTTVQRYTEGTLVLDILDARTGRLIYRAASEKKVTQKDATQANLNKMVAQMTKALPAA